MDSPLLSTTRGPIRRISIFGGPSCGKSAQAAGVYYELKRRGQSVEIVNEYVKNWAYENKRPSYFDQTFFFGTQMQSEYHYLKNKVELVVTDSPVFLAAVYAELSGGFERAKPMYELCQFFEAEFPANNIFINRPVIPGDFSQEGRFQDETEAIAIDKLILTRAREWLPDPVIQVSRDPIQILMAYYNAASQCPMHGL